MFGRAGSLALALLAGLLMLAVACGDDNGTTSGATATVSTDEAGTPSQDIRNEDLTAQPGLSDFLSTSGGSVNPERMLYADLTNDAVDEAIVPVGSGGEGGDIAVFVYGYESGGVTELLRALPEDQSTIATELQDGALVTSEPVYADGDPFCCPSQLRVKTYGWDGSALVVDDEELEQEPTPKGIDY
ncbi:MAG: hypothetical protein WEB04_01830 [Dehalococcoidia bacterium]